MGCLSVAWWLKLAGRAWCSGLSVLAARLRTDRSCRGGSRGKVDIEADLRSRDLADGSMLKRCEGALYLTYHQAAFEAARSVSSCLAPLSEIKSEKVSVFAFLLRAGFMTWDRSHRLGGFREWRPERAALSGLANRDRCSANIF